MTLVFNDNVMRQIRNVIDFADDNIYSNDDVLDMMNGRRIVPGGDPKRVVVIPPAGPKLCYFKVDNLNRGRCHYFQIEPDAFRRLPDKDEMQQILKAFGIGTPLLDEHITTDKGHIQIILPIDSK